MRKRPYVKPSVIRHGQAREEDIVLLLNKEESVAV